MAESTSKEADELQEQFAALKADVAAIAETLKDMTDRRRVDGVEAVKTAASNAKHRADEASAEVQKHVAERPLASLLIAFGVGFLAGKALERR